MSPSPSGVLVKGHLEKFHNKLTTYKVGFNRCARIRFEVVKRKESDSDSTTMAIS